MFADIYTPLQGCVVKIVDPRSRVNDYPPFSKNQYCIFSLQDEGDIGYNGMPGIKRKFDDTRDIKLSFVSVEF